MTIRLPGESSTSNLNLVKVLYSPEVGYTLISVGRLDDLGFRLEFGGGKCTIYAPDGKLAGIVPKDSSGLYRMWHKVEEASTVETVLLDEFHCKMAHISPAVAKQMVERGFVTGIRLDTSDGIKFCELCVYGKATSKPIAKFRGSEQATRMGGEVHSDVWGPAPVTSLGKSRYFATFIDNNTRLADVSFQKTKDETFTSYKHYKA